VNTLLGILDGYRDWRDNLPPGPADGATAQRLDEVLELRDLVEQLHRPPSFPQGLRAGLRAAHAPRQRPDSGLAPIGGQVIQGGAQLGQHLGRGSLT